MPTLAVRSQPIPRSADSVELPLALLRSERPPLGPEPVTVGVPVAAGRLWTTAGLGWLASRDGGVTLPVQLEALSRWADGSVAWLLADVILPPSLEAQSDWILRVGADHEGCTENRLGITETPRSIVVDTGLAQFTVCRASASLQAVDRARHDYSGIAGTRLTLTDRRGRVHAPRMAASRLTTQGPIRTTLAWAGVWSRVRGLRVEARASFFAGTGLVRMEITLHNPNRARHRGGLWDLGDPGSALFRGFSWEISLPGTRPTLAYQTEARAEPKIASAGRVEIYQDSSGGENWHSRSHVNRLGQIPCAFRGYRVVERDQETFGRRAEPTVVHQSEAGQVSVAVPGFWQEFPKAVELLDDRMIVHLFPRQWNDLHELQGGEQKSHTVWMEYRPADALGTDALAWTRQPAIALPGTISRDTNRLVPWSVQPAGNAAARLDSLLEEFLTSPAGVYANREKVDEFGWRHSGEIYADHEQAYYTGPSPLISHYNNQFDMVHGFLLQFLRTGDRRFWDLGSGLARHVIDIDIYRTTSDRWAYNGGLFWFTDHYLHAHTSTHRTYSRRNKPARGQYGGGPGAEHNFSTGLLLYYSLTGDPLARRTVIGLADWVIHMDDGSKTLLGILEPSPTGLASMAGGAGHAGPGRAAANSINTLLDGWLLVNEEQYLRTAEALIRRCAHPADDLEARDLLNVEKHWSYTMFLSSVARYLELSGDSPTRPCYAYAQAVLRHYARWMLRHERPYFDQVEKLEFPTEAWAAQEFRKANVLRRAACHAKEPLRSQLLERGDELAERAWSDLLRFETRTCARAMAVLMIEGLYDVVLRNRHQLPNFPFLNLEDGAFAAPEQFLGQRRRIATEMRSLRGAAKLTGRLVSPFRWWSVWRNCYSARVDAARKLFSL